jgi:DNA gyrase/topoisomerase IV subunit A
VQGINHLETIHLERKRNRTRTAIIVTELPFQVNKAAWIEKMADLVNQGKIEGIADLRDESDRTGMRVVIELKKGVEPENILEKLYKHTDLQKNFGVTLLALVDNKPVQLSLRQLLEEFLKFREETLTRQYSHELGECQKRLHLLEGLLIALNNLDQLIDILRHAADGTTAKVQLESRLEITPEQADSILAMPMRRITGLERQKITAESEELQTRITELETLLNNRHERLKALKKELRKLKKTFGDERRTRITKTPYIPPKKVSIPDPLNSVEAFVAEDDEIFVNKIAAYKGMFERHTKRGGYDGGCGCGTYSGSAESSTLAATREYMGSASEAAKEKITEALIKSLTNIGLKAEGSTPEEKLAKLVELNIQEQVLNLSKTSIIQRAWKHENRPHLHGWVYGLGDGLLKEISSMPPNSPIDPIYQYENL